jgi:hypothetical protein
MQWLRDVCYLLDLRKLRSPVLGSVPFLVGQCLLHSEVGSVPVQGSQARFRTPPPYLYQPRNHIDTTGCYCIVKGSLSERVCLVNFGVLSLNEVTHNIQVASARCMSQGCHSGLLRNIIHISITLPLSGTAPWHSFPICNASNKTESPSLFVASTSALPCRTRTLTVVMWPP